MTERDTVGLLFTAEMYGVQLDLLAARLGISLPAARAAAARWRQRGYAESAQLGPGGRWVWLTQAGLAACGLPYRAGAPALPRLAHLRAVTAVRLALEAAPSYAAAGGYWRSERRLRARMGSRVPLREHLPDGEVHWPDSSAGGPGWAGECWAIEAELTRKTVSRTAAIMTEILTRTGDYGCLAAEVREYGRAARHTRVLYLCSPAARPVVLRARAALPASLAARVEIRGLPASAAGEHRPSRPGQLYRPEPPGPHPPPLSRLTAPPSLVARRSSLAPPPTSPSPFPVQSAPRPFGST
jgi:hypothetical protein